MAAAIPIITLGLGIATTGYGIYTQVEAGEAERKAREREAAQFRRRAEVAAEQTEKRHRGSWQPREPDMAQPGWRWKGLHYLSKWNH